METYRQRSDFNKATSDRPWVFALEKELARKIVGLKSLVSEGIVNPPLQKRSLFITGPGFKTEGSFRNLCCIGEGEDPEKIKNPALSIAVQVQTAIGLIKENALDLERFGRIVVLDLALDEETQKVFDEGLDFILKQVKNKATEVFLYTDREKLPLNFDSQGVRKTWAKAPEPRPQAREQKARHDEGLSEAHHKEHPRMQTTKNSKPDLSAASQKIQDLLKQTLSYPDPEELEKVKKLIQQNVPLGRRTYLAAYLMLRFDLSEARPQKRQRPDHGPSQENRPARTFTQERRRSFSPVEGKTFYINVGYNDGMSNNKALAEFIGQNCSIDPDDVHQISLKSGYGFFTVKNDLADLIVPGLAGKTIGKKTIVANLANRKSKNKGPQRQYQEQPKPQPEKPQAQPEATSANPQDKAQSPSQIQAQPEAQPKSEPEVQLQPQSKETAEQTSQNEEN